jgi:hypothetical protein
MYTIHVHVVCFFLNQWTCTSISISRETHHFFRTQFYHRYESSVGQTHFLLGAEIETETFIGTCKTRRN